MLSASRQDAYERDRLTAVALFGLPGSGKTTMADALAVSCRFEVVSVSALLREECARVSHRKNSISGALRDGALLPDALIRDLILRRLRSIDGANVVLDGFPRTLGGLDDLIQAISVLTGRYKMRGVIFDADVSTAWERAVRRGRPDDARTKTLSNRFDAYTHETRPAIAAFERRFMTVRIDSSQSLQRSLASLVEWLHPASCRPE